MRPTRFFWMSCCPSSADGRPHPMAKGSGPRIVYCKTPHGSHGRKGHGRDLSGDGQHVYGIIHKDEGYSDSHGPERGRDNIVKKDVNLETFFNGILTTL